MSLHPRFIDAVRWLHPNVSFRRDLDIVNDSDGTGPRLVGWRLPGDPPTDSEIDALIPTMDDPAQIANRDNERMIDALDVVAFRAIFNHENRIRALEGRPALTAVQFRAALKSLL